MKKIVALVMAIGVVLLFSSCAAKNGETGALASNQPSGQTIVSSADETAASEISGTLPMASSLAAQKAIIYISDENTREYVKNFEEKNIYMNDDNNFQQPTLSLAYNDPMLKERLGDNFVAIRGIGGISRYRGPEPEWTKGRYTFTFMREGSTPADCEAWRFEGEFHDYDTGWEYTNYYLNEEKTKEARSAWKEDPFSKRGDPYYFAYPYSESLISKIHYHYIIVDWTPQ